MSLPTNNRGLQFMLLGGFDARLNGLPIAGFAYNKMRALLAYLAIEREQEHRREVLAELFWGSADPVSARGNLRRTLSDLRRVLELPSGATLFSSGKNSIRFIPDARIDVLDFAGQNPALEEEQIVALYRGEFLAGLSLPDNPEFEDWLQIQRETLHRRAIALLERLANRYEHAGDYEKALQFALRLTELEPWDENAHRKAMLLYALNGQSSAAIRQYDTCCQLLKNELATLPDEETTHLAERIRNGKLRRAPTDAIKPPRPQEPAERRQVTVLYCELSIDAEDDPDEAMDLLLAPQARCIEIIRQFSGHIVQTHGGGLLAYFGYPQAREDAAHRAVKAALAVIREAARGVEVRVGVHTGLVITGGESSLPDTSGRTSKIAIRIRKMAACNEVAISRTTHNIVAGYFDCIGLAALPLSGQTHPLEIFKVLQESGARTRLDAATQLTPLTGRETEINKLMKLWREVAQGVRHEVLIQGEAGIGKSRLLLALKERLAGQPHAIRELRCFPEFSQSPFYPLIAMLEGILDFAPDDTAEQRFAKLAAYLDEHFSAAAQNATPLLAALLSLPLSGGYRASGFSPQKQKEQTNLILIEVLHALARRQPVLLIVEDLHWIDPSTLELLTAFLEQDGGAAILTLLTARPEFVPPWKKTIGTTLVLPPLAGDEVAKMVAAIGADIPANVIRNIVERADGVPLFVEEVAKIARMDNRASIPSTLHDLLAARMDNMGEAKYAAQLAATIGREFDLNLMRKVSPDTPAALAQSLSALQDAGLILKASDTTRQFKHALIQEAAYQSQTRTKRQDAHRRIAQALLSDFPEVAGNRPELLAQHFACGGDTPQAIEYWIKAGQRAARHSANAEAIEHFNDGLKLLETLPQDRTRDHLESRLHLSLGAVLIATKGYGSVEAGQTYARALALCEQLDDNDGLYMALWGMWLTSSSRVGHSHSLALAKKLLRLAEQSRDTLQLQLAHYALGNSSLITGDLPAARSHLETSMALYKPEQHEILVGQYGENSYVSSGSLLSTVLWLQGFPAQANEVSRRTVAMARRLNHPNSLGYALCVAAMVQRWSRQIDSSAQLAHEAMALSHQHGLPFWLGFGASAYGWVMVMQGLPAGIEQMRQCAAAVNAVMSGSKILFLAPLNDALVHLGQFENALTELNETLLVVAEKDDRFLESEFNRLKGECLLQLSPADTGAAEACFDNALAISRRQGAKSLELRAAASMARLWQKQGKTDEARQLLEEIRQWFTEGHETSDLPEAADLLRALERA